MNSHGYPVVSDRPHRWTGRNGTVPLPTSSCVIRSQPDKHVNLISRVPANFKDYLWTYWSAFNQFSSWLQLQFRIAFLNLKTRRIKRPPFTISLFHFCCGIFREVARHQQASRRVCHQCEQHFCASRLFPHQGAVLCFASAS